MVPDESGSERSLEVDGVVPETAVNDQVPIPEGLAEEAAELIAEHVDEEREEMESGRGTHPSPELRRREAEFRDELAKRIVAEFDLSEEYEELQEYRREALESDTKPSEGGSP